MPSQQEQDVKYEANRFRHNIVIGNFNWQQTLHIMYLQVYLYSNNQIVVTVRLFSGTNNTK